MTKDQERFRICLQCVEEGPERIISKDDPLACIHHSLKIKRKWFNPWWPWYMKNNKNRLNRDLCGGCPYELEHLVIKEND